MNHRFIGLDIANLSTGLAMLELTSGGDTANARLHSIALTNLAEARPATHELENFINSACEWIYGSTQWQGALQGEQVVPTLVAYEDAMYSPHNFSGITLALYGGPLVHRVWQLGAPVLRVAISKLRYTVSPGKKMDRGDWPKLQEAAEARLAAEWPALVIEPIEGAKRAKEDQSVARAAALTAFFYWSVRMGHSFPTTNPDTVAPFRRILLDETKDKRGRMAGLIHRDDFYFKRKVE